jgi:hypothetical protein
MAKRKPLEKSDAAASLPPKAELPSVESPSISPAEPESKADAAPIVEAAAAPAAEADLKPAAKPGFAIPAFKMPSLSMPAITMPSFKLTSRQKRNALLAASVVFAALVGAAAGAMGTHAGLAARAPADAAGLEERQAMQQSIAHLSKEVASLKVSLDTVNKSAGSEIKKIADRLAAAAADVTGSVTSPQTVPETEAQAATPLPPPRPAPQVMAALEPLPAPPRPTVVPDWSIRFARDGMALVQGHGELFEAVLGAPLPGLGPVQTIKREDGRWMVVTPRGIIVSARDRHYFE